jgi:hypothetical protein
MFEKPFFAILHCFKVHPAIYDFEEMGIRPYNFKLSSLRVLCALRCLWGDE